MPLVSRGYAADVARPGGWSGFVRAVGSVVCLTSPLRIARCPGVRWLSIAVRYRARNGHRGARRSGDRGLSFAEIHCGPAECRTSSVPDVRTAAGSFRVHAPLVHMYTCEPRSTFSGGHESLTSGNGELRRDGRGVGHQRPGWAVGRPPRTRPRLPRAAPRRRY